MPACRAEPIPSHRYCGQSGLAHHLQVPLADQHVRGAAYASSCPSRDHQPRGINPPHESVQLIKRYNLGAHDAAHLASARLNGIGNLVSFDRGWRRVEELDLWNNVIFGDQPES